MTSSIGPTKKYDSEEYPNPYPYFNPSNSSISTKVEDCNDISNLSAFKPSLKHEFNKFSEIKAEIENVLDSVPSLDSEFININEINKVHNINLHMESNPPSLATCRKEGLSVLNNNENLSHNLIEKSNCVLYCNKPHYAKGLCKKCYKRNYYRNMPLPEKMCQQCNLKKAIKMRNFCKSCCRKTNKTKPNICKCDKPHYAKGRCRNCYYKLITVQKNFKKKKNETFIKKIKKTDQESEENIQVQKNNLRNIIKLED